MLLTPCLLRSCDRFLVRMTQIIPGSSLKTLVGSAVSIFAVGPWVNFFHSLCLHRKRLEACAMAYVHAVRNVTIRTAHIRVWVGLALYLKASAFVGFCSSNNSAQMRARTAAAQIDMSGVGSGTHSTGCQQSSTSRPTSVQWTRSVLDNTRRESERERENSAKRDDDDDDNRDNNNTTTTGRTGTTTGKKSREASRYRCRRPVATERSIKKNKALVIVCFF